MQGLFPSAIINAISDYFYLCDCRTRSDLSNDRVIGERDYLSRLITFLEYPYGIIGKGTLSFKHLYISNNFPGPLEQQYGCDTFFIFRNKSHAKCLAVEAKYPKFHQRNRGWDSVQKSNGTSHFSDQLQRQRVLVTANIPVLEMFVNHDNPGHTSLSRPFLDNSGSSFVDHSIAYAHKLTTATWRHKDGLRIIRDQHSSSGTVCISHFIVDLLNCKIGIPIQVVNNSLTIYSDNEESIRIPLVDIYEDSELDLKPIVAFMKQVGIRNLGIVQYQHPADRFGV